MLPLPSWVLAITAILICKSTFHTSFLHSLALGGIGYLSYVWLLNLLVIERKRKSYEPDWGLHQFHPAKEQEHGITKSDWLNVVFVHGLASNPATTWTARAERSNNTERVDWITKFLAPDLCANLQIKERLRMFYFNYESTWMYNASDARLREFGMTLRQELSSILLGAELESSRFLLVGHSFGGLVIKEALRSLDPDNVLTADKVAGVIFLGTPHRGSDFAWLGLLGGLITLPFDPNLSIMRNILYDSKGLADLHEDFLKAFGSVSMRNFYEAKKARIALGFLPIFNQYVVPEESATFSSYGDISKFRCNTDHSRLNKFPSRTRDYDRLKSEMLNLLASALNPTSTVSRQIRREILPPPDLHSSKEVWRPYVNPPSMDQMNQDFQEAIESRHPGTCHWIQTNLIFKSWKATPTSCILWLTGNLGSGKTILSTYLVNLLKQEILQKQIHFSAVVFALCNDHTLQDESEILRVAIHQILDAFPQLKNDALEQFQTAVENNPKASTISPEKTILPSDTQYVLHKDVKFLWVVFLLLATHLPLKGMLFVIDGLDHLQKPSSKSFLANLRKYLPSFGQLNVKFILTSRPDERIRESMERLHQSSYHRLQAEDEEIAISTDISTYLQDEVARIGKFRGYSEKQVAQALRRLQRDCEDMFLYAKLAVQRLSHTSSFDLPAMLDTMAKGLDAMYEQVLMDISPEIRSRQSTILLCLMYAYRPLRLVELESAISFSSRTRWPHNSSDTANVAALRKDLLLYGPLIRYREIGGTVHLVHQSAGEYLRKQANVPKSNHHPFLAPSSKAHEYLAVGCLQYLLRYQKVTFPGPWESGTVQKKSKLYQKYLLFDYALTYWHLHCAEALRDPLTSSKNSTLSELLRKLDLLRKEGGHDMFWVNALSNCSPIHVNSGGRIVEFRSLSSLEFFSAIGLSSFVDNILRKEDENTTALANGNHEKALTLAISHGHAPIVHLIVQHLNIMHLNERAYRTSISDAAWARNPNLVRELLVLRPNRTLQELADALYAAVETENLETAEIVLGNIDIRERDQDGMTILHRLFSNKFNWEARSNATVQLLKTALLLISRGADINAQDGFGNTVLHYVCYSYISCFWVVAKLVREGADPSIPNKAGWLPIHLAARRSVDVTTLIFLERCYPNSVFAVTRGRYTPLHWAANRGGLSLELDVGVLRWLLRKGLTLDYRTRGGETPLGLIKNNPSLAGALQSVYTWIEGYDFLVPSLTVTPLLRENTEFGYSGLDDNIVIAGIEMINEETFDNDESGYLSQTALLQRETSVKRRPTMEWYPRRKTRLIEHGHKDD